VKTHGRVVGVIYFVLAGLSLVFLDVRYLLVPSTITSIILFASGFVVFRRWSGAFAIPWRANTSQEAEPAGLTIEGTPCPFRGYDQELIVTLRVRRFPELAATVVLSVAALYGMISDSMTAEPLLHGSGLFALEFVYGMGLLCLLLNLRWFTERQFLRSSHHGIATVLSRDPGFFRSGITYQFLDAEMSRRGGRGPLWGQGNDNAFVVLYDPKDPDRNTVHGAFMFHRFGVALIPKGAASGVGAK
jgi:hypothetical protein